MSKSDYLLKVGFPFRETFNEFIKEYASCTSYWYIPKARALNDENVKLIVDVLNIIFENFLDYIWNVDTQDDLLEKLQEENILDPYKEGNRQDRTALTRIIKKILEVLGLLRVKRDHEIVITDAGLDLISALKEDGNEKDVREVVENQIAKWQYPNPSIRQPDFQFEGILPHLFLLQLLKNLGYEITREEYDLFVNLARNQEDLDRITTYIKQWRELTEEEQDKVRDVVNDIPMAEKGDTQQVLPEGGGENGSSRLGKISRDSPYQRSFYTYPSYLSQEEGKIVCTSEDQVNQIIEERLNNLKLSSFENKEDWFAYYGDPTQQPSWFTYLIEEIEKAESEKEVKQVVEEGKEKLSEEETETVEKKQVEKKIEDFYVELLDRIEGGLVLLGVDSREGRQYSTPIGRIDLLCQDSTGDYVIIEIKVGEAKDSVFGQILRYIGWVKRNMAQVENDVRGIILAGEFPDKARYSRIGLEPLNDNYKEFLKFEKHGLDLQNI